MACILKRTLDDRRELGLKPFSSCRHGLVRGHGSHVDEQETRCSERIESRVDERTRPRESKGSRVDGCGEQDGQR